MSEGSWLCLGTLPVPPVFSGHVALWTEQLLGSGFSHSSSMPCSRAGHAACRQEQRQRGHQVFHQLTGPKLRGFLPALRSVLHCPLLSICCLIDSRTSHRLTWLPNVSTHLLCLEKCNFIGCILVLLVPACNDTVSSVWSVLAQLLIPNL